MHLTLQLVIFPSQFVFWSSGMVVFMRVIKSWPSTVPWSIPACPTSRPLACCRRSRTRSTLSSLEEGSRSPPPAKPHASPAPKEEDEEMLKVAQSVNDERQLPEATMAVALAANAAQDEPLIRMDEEPSTHFAVSRNLRYSFFFFFFWGGVTS